MQHGSSSNIVMERSSAGHTLSSSFSSNPSDSIHAFSLRQPTVEITGRRSPYNLLPYRMEAFQEMPGGNDTSSVHIRIPYHTVIRPLRFSNRSFQNISEVTQFRRDPDGEVLASVPSAVRHLGSPSSTEYVLSSYEFHPMSILGTNVPDQTQHNDVSEGLNTSQRQLVFLGGSRLDLLPSSVTPPPPASIPNNLSGSLVSFSRNSISEDHPLDQMLNLTRSSYPNNEPIESIERPSPPVSVCDKQGLSLQNLRNVSTIMPFENISLVDTECSVSFEPTKLRTFTFFEMTPSHKNTAQHQDQLRCLASTSPLISGRERSSSPEYPASVDSKPLVSFGSSYKVCAICCVEFIHGDPLRYINKCNHRYHVACVDRWFENNSTCPICRCDLRPPLSTMSNTVDSSSLSTHPFDSV